MSITFQWSFPHLEVELDNNQLKNIIKVVHWRLRGTDDETGYSEENYGSISLPEPDEEEFIDYESVSKEDVEEWVKSAMEKENGDGAVESIENNLKNQIEKVLKEKAEPTVIAVAPAWE